MTKLIGWPRPRFSEFLTWALPRTAGIWASSRLTRPTIWAVVTLRSSQGLRKIAIAPLLKSSLGPKPPGVRTISERTAPWPTIGSSRAWTSVM